MRRGYYGRGTMPSWLTRAAHVLANEERAEVESRCAWCDHEAGIKPSMEQIQSHGICERHHAQVKAEIEELQAARDKGDL